MSGSACGSRTLWCVSTCYLITQTCVEEKTQWYLTWRSPPPPLCLNLLVTSLLIFDLVRDTMQIHLHSTQSDLIFPQMPCGAVCQKSISNLFKMFWAQLTGRNKWTDAVEIGFAHTGSATSLIAVESLWKRGGTLGWRNPERSCNKQVLMKYWSTAWQRAVNSVFCTVVVLHFRLI